jgi:hypothetical protein
MRGVRKNMPEVVPEIKEIGLVGSKQKLDN